MLAAGERAALEPEMFSSVVMAREILSAGGLLDGCAGEKTQRLSEVREGGDRKLDCHANVGRDRGFSANSVGWSRAHTEPGCLWTPARMMRHESHVILRITSVIRRPTIGSPISRPSPTSPALATTPRDT